jgi:hypothetical protein
MDGHPGVPRLLEIEDLRACDPLPQVCDVHDYDYVRPQEAGLLIHPDSELRFIDPAIGYGVFATSLIPKGTFTWVRDELDQIVEERRSFARCSASRATAR